MKQSKRRFPLWLAILALLGLYGFWYLGMHSMGTGLAYEVNEAETDRMLLLVTQESAYKDTVSTSIVAQLKRLPVHIRVVDLTDPRAQRPAPGTDACILLHTWEFGRPPGPVRRIRDTLLAAGIPLFVVTTSGSGEAFLTGDVPGGADGITSASEMRETDGDVRAAVTWAKLALGFSPLPATDGIASPDRVHRTDRPLD